VLDHACRHRVIIVAAAGNQAQIGGSVITCHPWVVPVVGYCMNRRPMTQSNLGTTIGRQGLGGPGEGVTSLAPRGQFTTSEGTSVAAPFITGACALLLSIFPRAAPGEVRLALTQPTKARRRTIIPPLLDAWAAYRALSTRHSRR
jgi:subtilisin family serine protease